MNDAGGYWFLQNISSTETGNKVSDFTVKNVYAPIWFSYHCGNTIFTGKNASILLPNFQVRHLFVEKLFTIYCSNGFQVQVAVRNGTFGDAYDCVGFTSVPIWSGLFVTFILLLIMTFGLTMMMDIRTMDRFDDPKGKTITINAGE